jgi:hypothetical protein
LKIPLWFVTGFGRPSDARREFSFFVMAKEKETDFIIKKLLDAAGIECQAEGCAIHEIQVALQSASKRGTGKVGFPEFVGQSDEFIIVIEDKASTDNQVRYVTDDDKSTLLMDKQSITNYAENGALHYALHIIKNTSFKKVLAFGCSGSDENRIIIRPIYVTPNGYQLLPRVKNFELFSSENIRKYYRETICGEEPIERVELKTILDRAKKLHHDLWAYGQLGDTEKPLVVSAILLALQEEEHNNFSTESLTCDDVITDGKKIFDALASHMDRVKVQPQVKKDRVLDQFRLIYNRPHLSAYNEQLGKSPLRYFAEYLHSQILTAICNNSPEDVLGRFYGEFIRYSGGDGQTLGVVLTPKHITSLFADLAEIKPSDIVFDPCCGTGGFLIAAMHRMLSLAPEDEKENIRRNNLHGIELRDDMFSIATTNMILRGDGKSNLLCDNFLKQDKDVLRAKNFTVGLMNPPYSQGKKKTTSHLTELKFICHLLDSLADNARCVVIVPQSTMVGKTKEDKADKQYILSRHTLEGVITLNTDTFYGVGTNPVIAVFTAHQPHPADKLSKFVDFKNDGYEVFAHIGLMPTPKAEELRKHLLDCWFQGKSAPNSFIVRSTVEADDEWLHSFYYFNDEIPTAADFEKTMADYLTFEFNMLTHGRGYLFEEAIVGKEVCNG